MQLVSDSLGNDLAMGYNYSRNTVGIVLKTQKDFGGKAKLGVIIPKFMMGYDFKNGSKAQDKTISISGSKFINDKSIKDFGSKTVIYKNYILVRPLTSQNVFMPNYTIGDKVIVGVIDDDIKHLIFYPYSINRLGQRATDRYVVAVPANPGENIALSDKNSYYLKMDSEKQLMELSTSEENGETTKQRLTFDSKEGTITLTDDKNRVIEINTNDDKVSLKTSGATLSLTGDVIDIKGDVLNIKTDTSINLETDKFTLKANSVTAEASDAQYKYDNYKQETQTGEWKVDNEKHEGMSMSVKETTYHNDTPTIGLNGAVIFPAFQIGNIPNINVVPPAMSGSSGPQGSMCLQTDPAGQPLVKYPALMSCLTAIASAADMYPSGAGAASAAVASLSSTMSTTKIMAS